MDECFESEIAVEWRGNEWMNGLFENNSSRVFFEGRIFDADGC